MSTLPTLIAMDLEGVLVPEIWIAVAEKTGIEKLRLTTRDISDYDELMRGRLNLLSEHNLTIHDIQAVIATLDPLPGAEDFVDEVRTKHQLVILSDTYYEFAAPLMQKLGRPTLFCNSLKIDNRGMIADYILRQKDGKRHAVEAFMRLNFHVTAVGDSYNDTTMLAAAHAGILFRPPDNVIAEFPQFPVATDYETLRRHVAQSTQDES
ncbi:MAG: bifunctional phosphoserine phosphatase/homoserine phosphotransferase ThrH [Candidatus Pacebacteria bacterium]|nr:bifunctional phosphoserine phosphatase/homoserine phosphotransferase ThrH [Candidatus Paceibacterota bacterium]